MKKEEWDNRSQTSSTRHGQGRQISRMKDWIPIKVLLQDILFCIFRVTWLTIKS